MVPTVTLKEATECWMWPIRTRTAAGPITTTAKWHTFWASRSVDCPLNCASLRWTGRNDRRSRHPSSSCWWRSPTRPMTPRCQDRCVCRSNAERSTGVGCAAWWTAHNRSMKAPSGLVTSSFAMLSVIPRQQKARRSGPSRASLLDLRPPSKWPRSSCRGFCL